MGNALSAEAGHLSELDNMFIAGCLQHLHMDDAINACLTCKRIRGIPQRCFMPAVFRVTFGCAARGPWIDGACMATCVIAANV